MASVSDSLLSSLGLSLSRRGGERGEWLRAGWTVAVYFVCRRADDAELVDDGSAESGKPPLLLRVGSRQVATILALLLLPRVLVAVSLVLIPLFLSTSSSNPTLLHPTAPIPSARGLSTLLCSSLPPFPFLNLEPHSTPTPPPKPSTLPISPSAQPEGLSSALAPASLA